jgi:ADP-ribose pyrophosphatase YjhB (NUDIX family)
MPAKKTGTDDGIMIAVGAVVLDETRRVLLVKHVEAKRGGYWFGKWICPGGKLKLGESLEEGTKREVREETGLDIELTGNPTVFDRIVKKGDRTELHVVYIDHVARKIRGQLKAGSDVAIARWFSKEELRSQWNDLHEDTRRLLLESRVIDEDVKIIA